MSPCPIKAETANIILKSLETVAQLEALTDYQIAQLLIEHIWSEHHVFSIKSDLIMEAIERLEQNE